MLPRFPPTWFILLKILTACAQIVIDDTMQDLDVTNTYCPKTEYCDEGTHVMCMYYNKKSPAGPLCTNYQAIDLTADMKDKIVDVLNAARAKLAMGVETAGKGGDMSLPRAYGMFRLRWDDELALFASVLANQCALKHDLCRSTKKFSKPGQTLGFLRFTIPDWGLRSTSQLSKKYPNLDPGFSEQKVKIALQTVVKSWYKDKTKVTKQMLESYPDYFAPDVPRAGKLYLAISVASATHVGCGMAGFSEITYKEFNHELDSQNNVIELVCNFSEEPEAGKPVYPTRLPSGSGFSPKCGCPEGTVEDEDCLCNFAGEMQSLLPCSTDPEQNCEQTVVLLPIFKMENAPKHKLDIKKQALRSKKNKNSKSKGNRFDLSKFLKKRNKMIRSKQKPRKHGNKRKSSIFSKVETFKLPHTKTDEIKKEVERKKEYSEVEQLINTYLSKHSQTSVNNNSNKNKSRGNFNDFLDNDASNDFLENNNEITTEAFLNNVEDKLMIHDTNFEESLSNITKHVNSINRKSKRISEDDEKKFLAVLDTLEREVRHIEFIGNQKEKFDEKLRKLYGTVLGKSVKLSTQKEDLGHKTTHVEHKSDTDFDTSYILDGNRIKHGAKHSDGAKIANHHYYNEELPYGQGNNIHRYNDIADIYNKAFRIHHYIDGDNREKDYREHIIHLNEDFHNRNNDFTGTKHQDIRTDYEDNDKEFDHKGLDNIHYVRRNDNPGELHSDERKIYQKKLNNLQRRLREAGSNKHNNEDRRPEQMRRLRPTRDELPRSPASKTQVDRLYIPDRAKYLHGF